MEYNSFATKAWNIFEESIVHYHQTDDVDTVFTVGYQEDSLEYLLFSKNWIDTVQWHLEDIIRDENIDPVIALQIKRRIDNSNQKRTDLVEYIDTWFMNEYQGVELKEGFRINTETPAWAVDRLSILALKVYHMEQEVCREDATEEHRQKCQAKLNVLLQQKKDLICAIDELLSAIQAGEVRITMYKQMKMYNDEDLNPILYKNKK